LENAYIYNDSNNCKTWWSILLYIEYELIIPFQLQLKSLTNVISQKTSGQVFHSNEHKCVEILKIVEKIISFERWKKFMLRAFISKSILYLYLNIRWNQWKFDPKKNTKCTQEKCNFFKAPPNVKDSWKQKLIPITQPILNVCISKWKN